MVASIVVDGVSKEFRLQADRPTSIKEAFTRRDRDRSTTHFWALKDVSLEIEKGSMYALIGHNGCGKSTLLRCIAGIYQPNEGKIQATGRMSTLLELGAGFHPDLSGRENVYLNATILGMSKREIDKAFDQIVDFAGDKISQFIDSPVKVYSTGMYVRLGFSVAVHVKPEILIIDEVIAVGDEQFQRQCFDHLFKLRREGTTIVVVTHGMSTVQTMCDQATWLDHGVVQESGPAAAVARSYLRRVNQAEATRDEARAQSLESEEQADLIADSDTNVDTGPEEQSPIKISVAKPSRPRITPEGDHWGSGEALISSVEFINGEGNAVTSVGASEPLRIRVGYEIAEGLTNPTFGIALHNEGGLHITGTNTRLSNHQPGLLSGNGSVEYSTAAIPLLPGTYSLSVALEDQFSQHTFDRYDYGWTLHVRPSANKEIHGLVDIGGDWKFADQADPKAQ